MSEARPGIITISNLRLRTVIGIFDWERECQQDIVLNIRLTFDAAASAASDNIADTVDYKKITKRIIETVEQSSFFLIEKLADAVLEVCLEDPKVEEATVRIDKPHALRFADSVSVELSKARAK